MKNSPLSYLAVVFVVSVFGFSIGRLSSTCSSDDEAITPVSVTPSAVVQNKPQIELYDEFQREVRPTWAEGNSRPQGRRESEEMRESLLDWAKTDPFAALSYSRDELRPLTNSEDAVLAILTQWAKSNPEEAWLWAQGNTPDHAPEVLFEIAKTVDSDRVMEMAAEHVEQYPDNTAQVYENITNGLIHNGEFRQAIDCLLATDIKGYTDIHEGKYQYIEKAVWQWMNFAPDEGKEWLKQIVYGGDTQAMRAAFSAATATWIPDNNIEAIEFAMNDLPKGEAHTAVISRALHHMIQTGENIDYAMTWLNEHGHGGDFDVYIRNIAENEQLIADDPEGIVGWVDSMADKDARDDSYVFLFSRWFANDEESAIAYNERHDILSPEQVETAREIKDALLAEKVPTDYQAMIWEQDEPEEN